MRIRGNSMLPLIRSGGYGIAIFWPKQWYKTGQLFYINHPKYGCIVKKLIDINDTCLWFCGENEDSVTRAQIGAVRYEQVVARVIYISNPPKNDGNERKIKEE